MDTGCEFVLAAPAGKRTRSFVDLSAVRYPGARFGDVKGDEVSSLECVFLDSEEHMNKKTRLAFLES